MFKNHNKELFLIPSDKAETDESVRLLQAFKELVGHLDKKKKIMSWTPVPATVSHSRSWTSLPNLAKMPTETERCIESLIAVFQKYSGKDGNNTQLSKTEFLSFMNTELAAFLTLWLEKEPPMVALDWPTVSRQTYICSGPA